MRILSVLLFWALFSCQNKQNASENTKVPAESTPSHAPVLNFGGKDEVDLGTIKEGETITHTFEFTNTGNALLQINYCSASCGCTIPSWPKEPIPVGGKGAITVEFNSKNKEGKLFKNVTIHSNTIPETTNVGFNVEVIKQ
jgi:hypothetical protein